MLHLALARAAARWAGGLTGFCHNVLPSVGVRSCLWAACVHRSVFARRGREQAGGTWALLLLGMAGRALRPTSSCAHLHCDCLYLAALHVLRSRTATPHEWPPARLPLLPAVGCINVVPGLWQPQWVPATLLLYDAPVPGGVLLTVIFEDEGEPFRHALDFQGNAGGRAWWAGALARACCRGTPQLHGKFMACQHAARDRQQSYCSQPAMLCLCFS